MNSLLASFIGFVIGAALCVFVLRTFQRMGLQAMLAGDPRLQGALATLARSSCLAHAAILDQYGHASAAACLVWAARWARAQPQRHLEVSRGITDYLRDEYDAAWYQGNMVHPVDGMFHCDEHGQSKWDGDVRCTRCLRTYHMNLADPESTPPQTCACGYRLLPVVLDAERERFLPSTGTRICRHCAAQEHPQIRDVSPPSPDDQERPVIDFPMTGLLTWGACPKCGAQAYLRFGSERGEIEQPDHCPVCGHKEPEVQGEGAQA